MKSISFHDHYETVLFDPTKDLDNKHSLGRGESILAKKGSIVEMIFLTWNNDRGTLAIGNYDNNSKMII